MESAILEKNDVYTVLEQVDITCKEHTIIIPLDTDLCNLMETIKSIDKYSKKHEIFVIIDTEKYTAPEVEIAKLMSNVVIKDSTLGKAFNYCISKAHGNYITIIKDNILVSPNWL